ncbi:hypothetical protein LUZ63_012682 [Rhynchospora breviuscula]|uniref:MADS-box domain-containing protein n=1 Tax=Rhynchospora breviuscula TaxID=2022672 RepID=A0A9Q0HRP3_9POAL|nr:hypothetical protein LUZ63_012682 [Rhynchospora breviuscula]
MGRNKIKIEKKAVSQQFVTYSKRKAGIAKKAKELAILCDTDVLLLTISPKGTPDLVLGPKSNFEDVIKKFSDQSPNERHKKKRECLQALSKAFKSDKDHEVDVEQLMKLGIPETSPAIKSQQELFKLTREIQHAKNMLGPLQYIDEVYTIANIGLLISMEWHIEKLIRKNRIQKVHTFRMKIA